LDNSTILFKSPPSKIFSINVIKRDGSTILEPIFDNSLFSKLRIELYNSAGKMITSYIDEKGQTRGPSVGLDNNFWGSNDSPFEPVVF
jgi:hypothetical protein